MGVKVCLTSSSFSFNKYISFFNMYLFNFWLGCVLVVAHRSLLTHARFFLVELWLTNLVFLQQVGSQFSDQGVNPHPLHWKVDS